MLRKKAVALALSMLMPTAASALGLGALKAQSGLNQPFDGRIEIIGATATDFDTLSIKLASTEAFERAGVVRDAVLLALKFEVVETPAGNDFIRISTREPVREPFLNFLLELNWANGRMVREYTVLLDPPLYDPNRRAATPTYTPAPAAARTPVAAPAPVAPNTAPPVAAPPPAPVAADGTLGTVQSSDTAWALAMRHRPDASVSVQRMMIALLRANPDAFVNGNINLLRRGAVLRMPAQADIDGLSQQEALAEVARQHQLWEDYRHGATAAPPAQPMVKEAPAAASTADADESLEAALAESDTAESKKKADDARLELVAPAPEGDKDVGAPDAGTPDTDQSATAATGEDAAALAAEGATTTAAAEAELKSKLDEASEIIDLLQRQVEIKDEELAKLQARLAELGVTPEAPAPTPATEPAAAAPTPAEPGSPTADDATPAPTTAAAEPTPAEQPATPNAQPAEPAAATPVAPPVAEKAPAPAPPPAKPKPVAPSPAPAAGPLDALIPAYLRDAVPGGAVTIVGVLGSLLLLVLAAVGKKIAGGRSKEIKAGPKAAPAAVAVATPVAAAAAATTLDEHDTVQPAADTADSAAADQFTRTLEATSEQLQGDPLEEVNVYLAYERFDQAEELVKKVIDQYPNEHKYKLRLLEIYYSANNKQAYEAHARDLLDAVGDHHPLWENAVAMWTEMSPHRALFAPGPLESTTHATSPAANEFVDVTGEATSPGGATMSMGPGDDGPLAVTAVGLTNDYAGGESVLDFDLTSSAGDAELEPMLDVTTGEAGTAPMIDLTATVEQLEKSGFLDLSGGSAPAADSADVDFDLSGDTATDLSFDDEDSRADTADLSLNTTVTPEAETADLLDITKTGNVTGGLELDADEPLLSVTAGSLADTASGAVTARPTAAEDEALNLDFDISDTVAPKLETDEGPTPDRDTDTDITTKLPAEEPLDFDIENLGLDLDLDSPSTAEAGSGADDEFDLTAESDEFALDLDAEAGADLDLSLRNPGLDMNIADGLSSTHGGSAPSDDDSDLEFDLALQDTTDFSKLDVDDTLELPKSSTTRPAAEPLAESLEDLTRSMEASLAGLDLDEEPTDEGLLDLDLGQAGSGELDLDFNLDDIQPDNAHDTLAMDHEDLTLERTGMHIDKTVVMPRDDNVEYQSEADEVDTKLNLAKAYIELGDSEGARAILDEVAREGTEGQQQEAHQLLSQLA